MKRELKWAFLMSALLLIWLTVLMFLGYERGEKAGQFWLYSSVFYIFQFAVLYIAVEQRKKRHRGYINRRDGFLTGLLIILVYILTIPIVIFTFVTFINPQFISDMVMAAMTRGELPYVAEDKYDLSSIIANNMILGSVIGGFLAAVVALITEKQPKKRRKNDESLA